MKRVKLTIHWYLKWSNSLTPNVSALRKSSTKVACEALKDELKESPRTPQTWNRPTEIATSTSRVIEIVSLITVKTSIAMKRVSCKGRTQTTVDLRETVKKVLIGAVCRLAIRREIQKFVRHSPRWAVSPTTTFTTWWSRSRPASGTTSSWRTSTRSSSSTLRIKPSNLRQPGLAYLKQLDQLATWCTKWRNFAPKTSSFLNWSPVKGANSLIRCAGRRLSFKSRWPPWSKRWESMNKSLLECNCRASRWLKRRTRWRRS